MRFNYLSCNVSLFQIDCYSNVNVSYNNKFNPTTIFINRNIDVSRWVGTPTHYLPGGVALGRYMNEA